MTTNAGAQATLYRENPRPHGANRSTPPAAGTTLEFGRSRVLLRQRQLFANGVPIELGTRAFDLLLVLLEANGSLVTKDQLFSRVWPGLAVADANLKVQISALRNALGEDRDLIRTEFGRGYRFIAEIRSVITANVCQRARRRARRPNQRSIARRICRQATRHSRYTLRPVWSTL